MVTTSFFLGNVSNQTGDWVNKWLLSFWQLSSLAEEIVVLPAIAVCIIKRDAVYSEPGWLGP